MKSQNVADQSEGTPLQPGPSVPYPCHSGIHQLFETQAQRTPEAVAIASAGQTLNYAQLNARANLLANYLLSRGARQGTSIAILLNRTPYCIIALLAVIKTGAVYVPIDPGTPPKRVAYFLSDSKVTHIIFDSYTQPLLSNLGSSELQAIDVEDPLIYNGNDRNPARACDSHDAVYCIYTSGSTGSPKGVLVHHQGLVNYVWWAKKQYLEEGISNFALFTSLAFDLTVTSIFVPLIAGGCIHIYPESPQYVSALHHVIQDNQVDVLKLTPSHLAMLTDSDLDNSRLKILILGGENLKGEAALQICRKIPGLRALYNEYGPTETVVGCMIYKFDPTKDACGSVPIGAPIDNMRIHLLDDNLTPVRLGTVGEIHIGGDGVSLGYKNKPEVTMKAFLADPFRPGSILYASGDLGSVDVDGQLRFHGRKDSQIKLRGHRVELAELESALLAHPRVKDCIVLATRPGDHRNEMADVKFCQICAIASNVPNTTLDDDGVCNHCVAYRNLREIVASYFGTMDELITILDRIKQQAAPRYDCLVALSGGKDSTFMLCRVVELGMRVLSFTLDNGYLSEEAKENIDRTVRRLNVDHRYLSTPHMKDIFADSLRRHSNVCNGCFKTIYTLAINLAQEVEVECIVMGLSKGQLFETRLSELFRATTFDQDLFERHLLEARKIYHRIDDAVSRLLDTRHVRDPRVIEKVRFLDFYRYCHVTQQEMYRYIGERVGWSRPSDTGRSTNCLINDVGIYVHNRERGYHNYALPYSWDVRMGHMSRDRAMHELNDLKEIDADRVKAIMDEIGYRSELDADARPGDMELVAYYVAAAEIPSGELRSLMAEEVPEYMLPRQFVHLDRLPLTPNGKVNTRALPNSGERVSSTDVHMPAHDPLQQKLVELWKDVLKVDRLGLEDNFFDIGGHSLTAAMLLYRVNAQFGRAISVEAFSRAPTVSWLTKQLAAGTTPTH